MSYRVYPGVPLNPTKASGLPVHFQNVAYVSPAGPGSPRDWRPSAPPARRTPTRNPRFVNQGI